ncbi:MAG: S9 family peptidase [Bacteroidetes bacterium]|nr:S9 family peptidase [Bacteroidota bacterium]
MKRFVTLLLLLLPIISLNAQQKHAMTVEDMWNMKRIGDFDLSPDGKTIAFSVTTYDMEKNKGNTDIYLIDADGQNLRPFKNSDENESAPKFSPDGSKIAYEYKDQIWTANVDGSDAKQLTNLYTGASGMVWSKDGKMILFVSSVYPDCKTQECNEQRDKEAEASKVKAKIFTELMYRHWNVWRGDKRSHLFLMNLETKQTKDLTEDSYADVPPIALGGDQDYSICPTDQEIAFTVHTDAWKKGSDTKLAVSTNNDVVVINPKRGVLFDQISTSKGNDNEPVYSLDGKFIAFRSSPRAGFESDKQSIVLYDRATRKMTNLTSKIDYSVGQILWSPDQKYIYFDADREAFHSIFKVNVATGEYSVLVKDGFNTNMKISSDGKTLYFDRQKTDLPTEIFSVNADGSNLKQITSINSELLSQIQFGDFDTFWSAGAAGAKVQSILIKPPFFDASKKYPLIFLIHGGPQGNWPDEFHYRWNLQLFASKGYVVVATNPRGSTGYGQKFTDEISGDWGGKVYTDLMNACDYAIKNFKFIDPKNTFAAGASYGGYMINWLEGHTSRFNAVVSHDGVYDMEAMFGATEELWFPIWEMKGTPWDNRTLYEKWSPNRFVKNFKTPMLIVQGANDFRIPDTQAMELFTALQLRGVPSKLLYFPDEYHFVTKPQNARLWWSTVFDWFNQYKK